MADVKPVSMHKRLAMGEKVTGMKKGGAVRHSDEAEDKALIRKMVKPGARAMKKGGAAHPKSCTCKMCSGGRVK